MKIQFYILIIAGMITSCSNQPATKLDSDDYANAKERIDKLRMAIKPFSEFKDAEFELFNVNGFNDQRPSVPGASSSDYKYVVRVDTSHVSQWSAGMTKADKPNYDDTWTKEIIKHRKQNWETNSKLEYYVRTGENVILLVYKNEGIIYKRVINL